MITRPSGLLLCRGKDEVVAQYALAGYDQPIGISDYQLSKASTRKSEICPTEYRRSGRRTDLYSLTRTRTHQYKVYGQEEITDDDSPIWRTQQNIQRLI